MEEEQKKKSPTAGVRIFESVMFPGEWIYEVFDKEGLIFFETGVPSEAEARAKVTRIKKVFRNRFLSVKTEK